MRRLIVTYLQKVCVGTVFMLALFILVQSNSVNAQCVGEKLTSPEEGVTFGFAADMEDETIVVGGETTLLTGKPIGMYYVFTRDFATSQWTQSDTLVPYDYKSGGSLTYPVSISGNRVIAGARGDDTFGSGEGSAYVFRYNTTTTDWNSEREFTCAFLSGDGFPHTGSIDGDFAVVGRFVAGAAHIFRFDAKSGAWSPFQYLQAHSSASSAYGSNVAIHGNTLVIGDAFANNGRGGAFIYRMTPEGSAFLLQQTISGSSSHGGYGAVVAIENDVVLIGGRLWIDTKWYTTVKIYRFNESNSQWEFDGEFNADVPGNNQVLASPWASIGNNTVAFTDITHGAPDRSIYFLQYDEKLSLWNQLQPVLASELNTRTVTFGTFIGAEGNYVVVSALGDMNPDGIDGAAYVFDLTAGDCNGDRFCDSYEINNGFVKDCNDNGLPDTCENYCPADLDCNNTVNVVDLKLLLSSWNQMHVPANLNNDDVVNVNDLLKLIGLWGPC